LHTAIVFRVGSRYPVILWVLISSTVKPELLKRVFTSRTEGTSTCLGIRIIVNGYFSNNDVSGDITLLSSSKDIIGVGTRFCGVDANSPAPVVKTIILEAGL
jgi:hypothetical protein